MYTSMHFVAENDNRNIGTSDAEILSEVRSSVREGGRREAIWLARPRVPVTPHPESFKGREKQLSILPHPERRDRTTGTSSGSLRERNS